MGHRHIDSKCSDTEALGPPTFLHSQLSTSQSDTFIQRRRSFIGELLIWQLESFVLLVYAGAFFRN